MARKIRKQGLKASWKDVDWVLHRKSLFYVPKIARTKLISMYHNKKLVGHFGIEKTQELIVLKYYWSTLQTDIESYVKDFDVC